MWVQQRDYKKVGRVLAEARVDAGLTQSDLAKKLRKPQSFISNLESGQRRLDILELKRVADAIGIDAAELIARILIADLPGKAVSKRR